MSRRLYLSPHLDDAVLSCGGAIARATAAGDEVEILTLFAGDEPESSVSPLVDRIYGLWGLPVGRIMAIRREEDRAACDRLAASPVWWDEMEAIHRLDPASGRVLYPDLAALFGPPAAVEERLVEALAERLRAHPPADLVVAPLGVGGHADHRIVRAAAERAFGARLAYYEEFPYVSWGWFALARARGARRDWTAESTALAPREVDSRIEAIGCYASQVTPLFRTPRRLARMVRRHVRRARGERLWRKSAAAKESAR